MLPRVMSMCAQTHLEEQVVKSGPLVEEPLSLTSSLQTQLLYHRLHLKCMAISLLKSEKAEENRATARDRAQTVHVLILDLLPLSFVALEKLSSEPQPPQW